MPTTEKPRKEITAEVEFFLARLYSDYLLLTRFVSDPAKEMAFQNLSPDVVAYLAVMDIQGLQLAAQSYRHKQEQYFSRKRNLRNRIWQWIRSKIAIKNS